MTTQPISTPTQLAHRVEVEARIVRRLQRMDYSLLLELDAATQRAESAVAQQPAPTDPPKADGDAVSTPALTRRQMLTRLAVGGTALATAGYVGARFGKSAEEADAQPEISHLRTILSLYEMMDEVGLDRLIATALTALGFAIDGLRLGATALRGAVDFIAGMLDRVEAAVPQILAGIEATESFVATIDRHIGELEQLIGEVLQEASPLTQAIDSFVQELLSYLPFGIGDRIRRTTQEMAALIGLLPAGVGSLRANLFAPMRAWFPAEDGADLRAQLFAPVRADLIEPTRTLLDDLVQFVDRWDSELAGPVQAALDQRAEVRNQIVAYQQGSDLPTQRISHVS